jgi:hypothetical protein
MFRSNHGLTVVPPNGESGVYTVLVPTDTGEQSFTVDGLRDECSCAATQGVACEHKAAVDEYAEQATAALLGHEPGAETLGHESVSDPATEHRPSYKREQVGMTETTPARPIWQTIATCSCGWTETHPKKDDAKVAFRAHRDGTTTETAAAEVAKQDPEQVYQNREDWLHAAKLLWWERMRLFGQEPVTNVRVGVGFTSSKRKTVRAECWRKEDSKDGTYEVIMGNGYAEPVQAFLTLGHELVHTNMEPGAGHGPAFRKYAVSLGFKPPITDSSNVQPELREWAEAQVKVLGKYPHAELQARSLEGGKPRQTNRWLKYECNIPECGWIVRSPKPDLTAACLSPLHFDEGTGQGIGLFVRHNLENEEA